MVQHMTSQEKLREAVLELTDGLRWNRMDVAARRVAPEYQQRFAETRRYWGGVVQIADAELVALQIGEDRSEASSSLAIRWYSQRTLTVHEAMLQQKWQRFKGGYLLVDEQVLQGDPRLLAPPPPKDDGDGEEAEVEATVQAPSPSAG
jgi:hypothetical protein